MTDEINTPQPLSEDQLTKQLRALGFKDHGEVLTLIRKPERSPEQSAAPLTIERAVEILNANGYQVHEGWQVSNDRLWIFQHPDPDVVICKDAQDAIAIARSLVQDQLIAALEAALHNDAELFMLIAATALKPLADAAVVADGVYDGRLTLAIVERLVVKHDLHMRRATAFDVALQDARDELAVQKGLTQVARAQREEAERQLRSAQQEAAAVRRAYLHEKSRGDAVNAPHSYTGPVSFETVEKDLREQLADMRDVAAGKVNASASKRSLETYCL